MGVSRRLVWCPDPAKVAIHGVRGSGVRCMGAVSGIWEWKVIGARDGEISHLMDSGVNKMTLHEMMLWTA